VTGATNGPFELPNIFRSNPIRAVALALALGTFALYLPTLAHDFVLLDDPHYVVDNSIVQRGLTLDGVRWAFTTTTFANWLPVTWLSHMLDCQLFGLWAGGHHLTSAALHALNAALVFLVLRAMTGAVWRPAAVAALFAVHPLRVESVAWVAERKDVLCATFGLLTMLAWVGYCRTRSLARYAAALALYALGLMSKTMIVTLPFLLLLLDVWPLRRAPGIRRFLPGRSDAAEGDEQPDVLPQRWTWLVLEKLPLFALAAIASAWTAALQRSGGAMRFGEQFSLAQRLGNALVSIPRYLEKTLRPIDLSVFYPHPGSWPAWAVTASALLIAGITVAVVVQFRRRPYLAVGWFWFLGMLVPVVGLVQVGPQAMADRYTYLPTIGLFMALVWWVADVARDRPRARRLLRPAVAGVIGVLAIGTLLQQRAWAGSRELFEHAVAVNDRDWLAHGHLGVLRRAAGDPAGAVEHFRKAMAANPTHPDAMHNLGIALQQLGRRDEAIAAFREATRHPPPRPETHAALGQLLADAGNMGGADTAFAEAERLGPTNPAFPLARARLAQLTGRPDAAADHYRRVLQLDPGNEEARAELPARP
jgi:tetratricopeptide (TPR) repeat protein